MAERLEDVLAGVLPWWPDKDKIADELAAAVRAHLAEITTAEDERRKSVLFNDVTRAPIHTWLYLSDRVALRDYLWEQGWRRDVRPEDVTP